MGERQDDEMLRQGPCPFCERTVLSFEEPPRCPLCACPLDETALRPYRFPRRDR